MWDRKVGVRIELIKKIKKAEAQAQGHVEVDKLKAQAESKRQELRNKTGSRMATAAAKVTDYLRG
jgi:vacuolar-type H+-ATPase subunit H